MIVYCMTNNVTGKSYIGQTIRKLSQRVREHVKLAESGSRYPIHGALAKYGIEQFSVKILQECSTIEELNASEIRWIRDLSTTCSEFGYNLSAGGAGVHFSGWNHSEKAKLAISVGNKGKVRTPEVRKMISDSVKTAFTDDVKQQISVRTN